MSKHLNLKKKKRTVFSAKCNTSKFNMENPQRSKFNGKSKFVFKSEYLIKYNAECRQWYFTLKTIVKIFGPIENDI